MNRISGLSGLAFVLLLASSTAWAQPNISDVLRQVPPPPPQESRKPVLPELKKSQPAPPLKKLQGPRIKVSRLEIAGNSAISGKELLALVKDAEGQNLTLGELEELAGRITRYYRKKGYFVARAYLPEQEVRGGVVTIRIIEGHYDDLALENDSLVKDEVLQSLLDDIVDHNILSTRTTERAILIMNRMPGARIAYANVMPGRKAGTSKLAVGVAPTPRFTGYAMADNYGMEYTGKKRLSAGVSANSPLGRGDRLSASGMVTEGQYIKNYRLAYAAPLLSNGLRAELAAGRTDYQLTGAFAALDAVGKADTLEAGLSYPFILTQVFSVEGGLNLAHRKLTDEIRSTATVIPKTADTATASLQSSSEGLLLGFPGTTTVSASATLGRLDFDDPTAALIDSLGARTEGRYGKLNASVGRSTFLRPRWILAASLKAQKALYGKNLDGSEDMSVSGYGGVRAYPVSELAAENAYLFNAEVQHILPPRGALNTRLGLFADVGYAEMENQVAGEPGARTLSDAGLAAYANYRNYFATLQAARRITRAADSESTPSTKLLLQVGGSF